jgi:dTDP-4-dehydrorhamnose 3,5-epimerase-like enzyme
LVAFSLKDSFPIKVRRIFIINGKKNFTRGEHAHKECSQFLFPILGKIKIECISNNFQKKLILNSIKNEGYLVKPKTWLRIKFLTKDSILMVACDKEYDFNDYIEKFSEFLKIIKKNNR